MYPPLKLSIPIISTFGLFSIIQSASLDPKRPATPVINTFIFFYLLLLFRSKKAYLLIYGNYVDLSSSIQDFVVTLEPI